MNMGEGNGQGSPNGPARSKPIMALVQAMVEKHMPGAAPCEPPGGGETVPELVAADDAVLLSQSAPMLQLGLEAFWMAGTVLLGLTIGHSADASKTAVKGGKWIK